MFKLKIAITFYCCFSTLATLFVGNSITYASTSDGSLDYRYTILGNLQSQAQKGAWFKGPLAEHAFTQSMNSITLYSLLNHKQRELLKDKNSDLKHEMDKKITDEKIDIKSPGFVTSSLQTYTLVYLLALIHIVVEDQKLKNIDPSLVSDFPTTEKLLDSAYDLAFSGEMISSLLMAGASHIAFKKPLELFANAINNTQFQAFIKTLFIHSASTLVSFTGWEFGAQLWNDATSKLDYQLRDKVDSKYLKEKNLLLVQLFRIISQGKGRQDTKEVLAAKTILAQTTENILLILKIGSDEQYQWIYNSFRHRIMGGHFWSMISGMAGASSIAATLFPLMNPWGALFGVGLAGGIVSMYIVPEVVKNSITNFFQNARLLFINKMHDVDEYLSSGFKLENDDKKFISEISTLYSFNDVIEKRIFQREKIVDVYLERTFYYYNLLVFNDLLLHELNFLKPTKENKLNRIKKMSELIEKNKFNREEILKSLQKIISLYLTDAGLMARVNNTINEAESEQNFNQELKNYLSAEVTAAETLTSHFCRLAESLIRIDFIRNNKIPESSSQTTIINNCNLKEPSKYLTYEELNLYYRLQYESSIRFLNLSHFEKFDEKKLTINRTEAMLSKLDKTN